VSVQELLRALPSVDELVNRVDPSAGMYPRRLVIAEARRVLAAERDRLRNRQSPSPQTLDQQLQRNLHRLASPSQRSVINASGVILHTNLGRAPLPRFEPISGYSNLEYDLESGKRGKRDVHISGLLEALLGKTGIAVNNNAAAVYLTLHELAAGYEVIVSRGELIEIGDGFRIPDIMQRSGAILREVGTTNRTTLDDYSNAITDRTRLIMRVHPSNFHMEGFTAKPELGALAALAHERNVPLYEDLGSGCVVGLQAYGIQEPLATESLNSGVNVISFSADKLLGGPQTGIVAGDPALVARIRRNPMFRAFRVDKLILRCLETTLRHLVLEQYDEIPTLRMLAIPAAEIRKRAENLRSQLSNAAIEIVEGESVIGGGSTPAQSLTTWLISIAAKNAAALEEKLRLNQPPVIVRIENDRILIDLRTVAETEEADLLAALRNTGLYPGV
jgi:L-seryl-tRNA(Ser) seleniumtransferase